MRLAAPARVEKSNEVRRLHGALEQEHRGLREDSAEESGQRAKDQAPPAANAGAYLSNLTKRSYVAAMRADVPTWDVERRPRVAYLPAAAFPTAVSKAAGSMPNGPRPLL